MTSTIVSAADAGYFALLKGLILSIREKPDGAEISLSILDVGLNEENRRWLKDQGAEIAVPEWDFDVPAYLNAPSHFRALLARPFLPRYFPKHDIYLHIDADAWVQDWNAIEVYIASAAQNQLAITPQVDRSYNTIYKRPRPYRRTQNYRSFKWSYGVRIADRIARNPILNCGVFALPAEAPHWNLWAIAIRRALERRTFPPRRGWPELYFKLIEQTAMNYVVFADGADTTLLPSTCNWFCAHAAPIFDPTSRMLVEPNAPYQPLGIIHLAGEGFQDQAFDIEMSDRKTINTRLRYEDIQSLQV